MKRKTCHRCQSDFFVFAIPSPLSPPFNDLFSLLNLWPIFVQALDFFASAFFCQPLPKNVRCRYLKISPLCIKTYDCFFCVRFRLIQHWLERTWQKQGANTLIYLSFVVFSFVHHCYFGLIERVLRCPLFYRWTYIILNKLTLTLALRPF